MASSTLIVSIVGIGVSGVVGPAVTSFAARVNQRRQFLRDREVQRRDELLTLLDEAATLLGLGAVRLRQILDGDARPDVQAWPEQVYSMGQRLSLRLGSSSPIVESYERVRERLIDAGKLQVSSAEQSGYDAAVQTFEAARGHFLDSAHSTLEAPIRDTPAKELKS